MVQCLANNKRKGLQLADVSRRREARLFVAAEQGSGCKKEKKRGQKGDRPGVNLIETKNGSMDRQESEMSDASGRIEQRLMRWSTMEQDGARWSKGTHNDRPSRLPFLTDVSDNRKQETQIMASFPGRLDLPSNALADLRMPIPQISAVNDCR